MRPEIEGLVTAGKDDQPDASLDVQEYGKSPAHPRSSTPITAAHWRRLLRPEIEGLVTAGKDDQPDASLDVQATVRVDQFLEKAVAE